MPDAITVNDEYGTYYYIDSSSSRDRLSWEQMLSNGTYFRNYCADKYPDWTLQAISAMLGNIQSEGIMNPSQWEYGRNKSLDYGYGLVQWTPATKFLNWAQENGYSRTQISGQVERIGYEAANSIQWISATSYPMSFEDFLSSEDSPSTLASTWLYNYERPKYPGQTEQARRNQANVWYEYLSGEEPDPPHPPIPTDRKRMPIYMYAAFRSSFFALIF